MVTATVTSKGQVVIPFQIRKQLHIKKGTRLCITYKDNEITLKPLTKDYFEHVAGVLKTKGKLTRALIKERAQEKKLEKQL